VDGRVLIDSAPGAGTTVHADLPALHREGDDPVTTTPPHRSAQG
jgi:hypothetical protein